jgi:hypothetical protein
MRSVLRCSVKFLILGSSGPRGRRGRRRPAVRVLADDDQRDPGARDQRGQAREPLSHLILRIWMA